MGLGQGKQKAEGNVQPATAFASQANTTMLWIDKSLPVPPCSSSQVPKSLLQRAFCLLLFAFCNLDIYLCTHQRRSDLVTLKRMPKPIVTDIQIRFGDTDMLGHINNAAYVQYLEVARMQLVQEALKSGVPSFNFVLAHISLDFKREIKLGKKVTIESLITRIGNSSFEMAYSVLADGVVCATAKSVQVGIDPVQMTAAPLPEPVRQFLQGFMGPQEEVECH